MSRFNPFIRTLAAFDGGDAMLNPWLDDRSPANRIRRRNLRRYLARLDEIGCRVMFVGEALGHRGGRLSGVPFTSLDLLLSGSHPLLGSSVGYADPGDGGSIRREASATMIWEAIATLSEPPLLWNACPFHPHRSDDPQSNRRPGAAEVETGDYFLKRLARLYRIERFVAVGRVAANTLDRLGIDHRYVRHPSVGGKGQFLQGLESLSL